MAAPNTSTVPPSPRDYGWYNGRPGKSISHWGMFDLAPRMLMVAADFDFTEQDRAEWLRPGGFIEFSGARSARSIEYVYP